MKTVTATGPIVLLTRLARVVYQRSTVELVGMRLKELGALTYLRDHHQATQTALSKALSLDANNCVLLLNDLEALQYIERRRDPMDRRRHLVELTTAGRVALERAELAQAGVEDDVLGALSAEERCMLQRLLLRALEGQLPTPTPTPMLDSRLDAPRRPLTASPRLRLARPATDAPLPDNYKWTALVHRHPGHAHGDH